ncbi:MAG: hydrolase [Euryarchaeota archaeon]|nr:hydrolase [Euryarchaeota archaeon]
MPGDTTHNITGILLLGIAVYVLAGRGVGQDFLLVFVLSYLFSLLWLSPDLDVDRGSGSLRRWGPLGFLWYPYKELFRHRGISHSILLGPLTRVAYLAGMLWLALWLLSIGVSLPWPSSRHLGPLVLGLWLPDTLHCLLDRCLTWLKR